MIKLQNFHVSVTLSQQIHDQTLWLLSDDECTSHSLLH